MLTGISRSKARYGVDFVKGLEAMFVGHRKQSHRSDFLDHFIALAKRKNSFVKFADSN